MKPTERKFRILDKLLEGLCQKQIAHEEDVTTQYVSLIKTSYPLLFWKDKE